MRRRTAFLALAVVAAVVAAVVLATTTAGNGAPKRPPPAPGEPVVEIVSPRNGARQASRAVVVKVKLHNFTLAPRHFGREPQLGEGNIRFGLNRVPDCVDPEKLQRAIESPIGKGRLVGASSDFARYAGPNGVLAERIGSAGSYSPATQPEIYYHNLKPGFYRLVITLAENSGAPTPYHAVTNFQILDRAGHSCGGGKVSSAKAASLE
ncbi:MAG: hypothetical protein WBM00_02645 [Solirubrobacterales bacterium]